MTDLLGRLCIDYASKKRWSWVVDYLIMEDRAAAVSGGVRQKREMDLRDGQ